MVPGSLQESSREGLLSTQALAGGKCVEVSWCWWAAKHASGPRCLRKIRVLVLLVRKDLGLLVEYGWVLGVQPTDMQTPGGRGSALSVCSVLVGYIVIAQLHLVLESN